MGLLDFIFLAYFISHIPITILLDSQSIIPRASFPGWDLELLNWHIKVNGDHLVDLNPIWFKSLVYCEVLLQLPFFFIASYAIYYKKNWIRLPGIIYGAHVSTTLIPILAEILFGDKAGPLKYQLAAIYAPYLVIPFTMLVKYSLTATPFPRKKKKFT